MYYLIDKGGGMKFNCNFRRNRLRKIFFPQNTVSVGDFWQYKKIQNTLENKIKYTNMKGMDSGKI